MTALGFWSSRVFCFAGSWGGGARVTKMAKRVSGSASYLKGMVESPLEFRSGEALDNLTPNLKLLGGAAAVSAALVGGFLAANGVL